MNIFLTSLCSSSVCCCFSNKQHPKFMLWVRNDQTKNTPWSPGWQNHRVICCQVFSDTDSVQAPCWVGRAVHREEGRCDAQTMPATFCPIHTDTPPSSQVLVEDLTPTTTWQTNIFCLILLALHLTQKNLNSTPKLIFHFIRMLLNSKQLCPGLLGTWRHRILWLVRVTNQYFHWAASQCRSSKQNNLSNFSCKDFAKSSVSSDLTRPYYLRGL